MATAREVTCERLSCGNRYTHARIHNMRAAGPQGGGPSVEDGSCALTHLRTWKSGPSRRAQRRGDKGSGGRKRPQPPPPPMCGVWQQGPDRPGSPAPPLPAPTLRCFPDQPPLVRARSKRQEPEPPFQLSTEAQQDTMGEAQPGPALLGKGAGREERREPGGSGRPPGRKQDWINKKEGKQLMQTFS